MMLRSPALRLLFVITAGHNMQEQPQHIVILGAMPEEVATVKAALSLSEHRTIGPTDFYIGKIHGTPSIIVCSGIGKVHAAIASTLAIQYFNPSCLINIGTSGALETHLQPGGIILSETVLYHDVDVTGFGYEHGQIPKMPADYQASHALLKLFAGLANHLALKYYNGLSVTGDQFIANTESLTVLKRKFPTAIAIDMEGASIAHVAHLFKIPFISVRAISDHANEHSPNTFTTNLSSAADNVAKLVVAAIADIPKVLAQQD